MKYKARDLAAMSKDDLWGLPDGMMEVEFDDGTLSVDSRATIFSAYTWDVYLRYPETPALRSHHLNEMNMGADTHMVLLGRVMWAAIDHYRPKLNSEQLTYFVEELCKMAYKATNAIYNDFTYRLEAHVTTLSALDFIDVIKHPLIEEANDNAQPNRLSIDKAHARIKATLMDPNELTDNAISRVAKNGLVSMGQILQCVGPRGYLTDVDSTLFTNPIMTGFAHGLSTLEDKMKESRSASKALTFTEKPLQDTEYFNRRLQLLAGTLSTVVHTDCGSTQYMDWHVDAGDLAVLAGKYYMTDEGLKRLSESDTHLRGQTIKMRTIFYCNLPDTTHVCSTCFGELALNIPPNTNIGHVSATALCEQVSQKVLSVKHEDNNSASDAIELSEYDQKYIRAVSDPPSIKLSERMAAHRVVLTILASEASRLPSIEYADDVGVFNPALISDLTEVRFSIFDEKGERPGAVVPVSAGTRHSSISHELLDYIKRHRWQLDGLGNYQIDLSEWDSEMPLFVLPPKHTNMLDYMKTIETFIKATRPAKKTKQGTLEEEVDETVVSKTTKGKSKGKRSLLDHASPETALREFNQLVSSQLKVHISHLEVLIRVTMIASRQNRDYRIPRPGNTVEWGAFNDIVAKRSLSPAMAFEKHRLVLNTPSTYLVKVRPPHILDPLLIPTGRSWQPTIPTKNLWKPFEQGSL